MTNKKDVLDFYIKLIRDTAQGIQKKVCEVNGISLSPQSAHQLKPIPVYEDSPLSLLQTANIGRKKTDIRWATNQTYGFLPAYFKRIRDENGRLRNEIVVVTGNYCEARFFAAKELMHCFMDNDGYEATNSIELVNDLIESLAIGSHNIQEPRVQTIVDEVAWLGASEYLVPTAWVPLLQKVHAAISANAPNSNAYFHLAQIIRVPEIVLRVRLREALKV